MSGDSGGGGGTRPLAPPRPIKPIDPHSMGGFRPAGPASSLPQNAHRQHQMYANSNNPMTGQPGTMQYFPGGNYITTVTVHPNGGPQQWSNQRPQRPIQQQYMYQQMNMHPMNYPNMIQNNGEMGTNNNAYSNQNAVCPSNGTANNGNIASKPRTSSRCDSARSETAESSCSSLSTDSQMEHNSMLKTQHFASNQTVNDGSCPSTPSQVITSSTETQSRNDQPISSTSSQSQCGPTQVPRAGQMPSHPYNTVQMPNQNVMQSHISQQSCPVNPPVQTLQANHPHQNTIQSQNIPQQQTAVNTNNIPENHTVATDANQLNMMHNGQPKVLPTNVNQQNITQMMQQKQFNQQVMQQGNIPPQMQPGFMPQQMQMHPEMHQMQLQQFHLQQQQKQQELAARQMVQMPNNANSSNINNSTTAQQQPKNQVPVTSIPNQVVPSNNAANENNSQAMVPAANSNQQYPMQNQFSGPNQYMNYMNQQAMQNMNGNMNYHTYMQGQCYSGNAPNNNTMIDNKQFNPNMNNPNPNIVQSFHQVSTVQHLQMPSGQVKIMQQQQQYQYVQGQPINNCTPQGMAHPAQPDGRNMNINMGMIHPNAMPITNNNVNPNITACNGQNDAATGGFQGSGAGPTDYQIIVVPFGWQRIINNGQVVYISPSGNELRSKVEVSDYLTTEGTCKCGLSCPLRVDNCFSFDPKIYSRSTQQFELSSGDMTKLCNHRRKLAVEVNQHIASQAAKKEDGRKKRKRKSTEAVDSSTSGEDSPMTQVSNAPAIPAECIPPQMAGFPRHPYQHGQQQMVQQPQGFGPHQGWGMMPGMQPRMMNPSQMAGPNGTSNTNQCMPSGYMPPNPNGIPGQMPNQMGQGHQNLPMNGYSNGPMPPHNNQFYNYQGMNNNGCCDNQHRFANNMPNGPRGPIVPPGFTDMPRPNMCRPMGDPTMYRGPMPPNMTPQQQQMMMAARMRAPFMGPRMCHMPPNNCVPPNPEEAVINGSERSASNPVPWPEEPPPVPPPNPSEKRKRGGGRGKKRQKTTQIERVSPCPNVDVRLIRPDQQRPNIMGGPGPPVSGPSFMEDPSGYMAQQTALLNNTMAGGVGQFSPQTSVAMSRSSAAASVQSISNTNSPPSTSVASSRIANSCASQPSPSVVPLPSNVPLPNRVSKMTPTPTTTVTSVQSSCSFTSAPSVVVSTVTVAPSTCSALTTTTASQPTVSSTNSISASNPSAITTSVSTLSNKSQTPVRYNQANRKLLDENCVDFGATSHSSAVTTAVNHKEVIIKKGIQSSATSSGCKSNPQPPISSSQSISDSKNITHSQVNQINCDATQSISGEKVPELYNSSLTKKKSLANNGNTPKFDDVSKAELISSSNNKKSITNEVSNKPINPGPAVGNNNTQSPLEMVQNIVSSIPVPASAATMVLTRAPAPGHQQILSEAPHVAPQLGQVAGVIGPQVYTMTGPGGVYGAAGPGSVVRATTPIMVQGNQTQVTAVASANFANNNMMVVSAPFAKVSNVVTTAATTVSAATPIMNVQTMPPMQVQSAQLQTHLQQLQPVQPVVQLVNTFATMHAPVIIQNGSNLIQSSSGMIQGPGGVLAGPASILPSSGSFMANQPIMSTATLTVDHPQPQTSPQVQVAQVVTSGTTICEAVSEDGISSRRSTPVTTPTPTTPRSTPGSTPGSETPPSGGSTGSTPGGRRRKRKRNTSTPQSTTPCNPHPPHQNIVPAIIMGKQVPQHMLMNNTHMAQVTPYGHVTGAQMAQVATMGGAHAQPSAGQMIQGQTASAINVVQMVGGAMAGPLPVHVQPSPAILVPSTAAQGVIINQLPDGTFISTDPNTGVSYPVQLQLSGSHIVGMTPVTQGMVGSIAQSNANTGTMVTVRPPNSHPVVTAANVLNISPTGPHAANVQMVTGGYGASTTSISPGQAAMCTPGQVATSGCDISPRRAAVVMTGGNATVLRQKTTTIVAHRTTLVTTQGGDMGTHSSVSTQTPGGLGESDVSSSDNVGTTLPSSPSHQSAEVTTTRHDEDQSPPHEISRKRRITSNKRYGLLGSTTQTEEPHSVSVQGSWW